MPSLLAKAVFLYEVARRAEAEGEGGQIGRFSIFACTSSCPAIVSAATIVGPKKTCFFCLLKLQYPIRETFFVLVFGLIHSDSPVCNRRAMGPKTSGYLLQIDLRFGLFVAR